MSLVLSLLYPIAWGIHGLFIVPKRCFRSFEHQVSSQKAAVRVCRISILFGYGNSKNETHNTKNDNTKNDD